jgi:hypothetical protein
LGVMAEASIFTSSTAITAARRMLCLPKVREHLPLTHPLRMIPCPRRRTCAPSLHAAISSNVQKCAQPLLSLTCAFSGVSIFIRPHPRSFWRRRNNYISQQNDGEYASHSHPMRIRTPCKNPHSLNCARRVCPTACHMRVVQALKHTGEAMVVDSNPLEVDTRSRQR